MADEFTPVTSNTDTPPDPNGTTPVTQSTPGVITPDSLQHTTPLPLAPVTPTPPYSVAGLDATPPLVSTPQENKESDTTSRISQLYDSLSGKGAFQSAQDAAQGIPELTKMQNELSARLTSLQNEALAIPQQLQLGAEGRGVTAAGLQPIQTGALRTNAIAALGVKTLFEASKGNLTLAQDLSDHAVAQKYGPIEEQIKALTANLNLIKNNPQTSLEDKNRAQAQLDIQKQKAVQIAAAKDNAAAIWSVATAAAGSAANFTPTSTYSSLTSALEAISKATTKQEALQIAAATGLVKPNTNAAGQKILGNATTGYFVYDPTNGKTTPLGVGGNSGSTSVSGTIDSPLSSQVTAPPSTYKFNTTQLDSGAAGAALTTDAFKKLPGEVQNFYVNSKALVKQFDDALSALKTGGTRKDATTGKQVPITRERLAQKINAMNIPQSVKDHLLKQLPPDFSATNLPANSGDASGNILTNAWQGIKSYFNI